ncbi:sulfur carrier protein ThiS [Marinobacter salinisoli]|uniref:Sulfur carrier protein ThiS n=1 Tax=Marinobacter salinisoli TaxID=2769486 RepID=A0ABX7MSP7_9GAMM|nr:sulfur carrier protein ThiS [Marinobacter salinisoli]QSP95213.1 sulfur carrier protein ThiS [Marinobacter salinisoli]
MQVEVNGEPTQLPPEATVGTLIEQLALTGRRLAVEVNEAIVPRSQHQTFNLRDGDRVEVVQAIGGG